MTKRAALLLMVGLVLLPVAVDAVKLRRRVTIEKVMSTAEQRETGVASLTARQRVALENWINNFATKLLEAATRRTRQHAGSGTRERRSQDPGGRASGVYPGAGGGHWIEDVSSGGAIIKLEDGSVWEIETTDQVDTALWLPVTDITVLEADSPVGPYSYMLVNTEDGEKALARFLGMR